MSNGVTNLIAKMEDLLPGWMKDPSRSHWVGLLNTIALVFDTMIDGVYEGRKASFPGQVDTVPELGGYSSVDALPYIGRDRRLPQGFAETNTAYARRLRSWRAAWRRAGTARGLLRLIRAATAPSNVRLKIVTAQGVWYTFETDGTFRVQNRTGTGFVLHPDGTTTLDTGVTHPWDWDSLCQGYVADPFRIWIIIDAPAAVPLNANEGTLGDGTSYYGDPDMTVGTTATLPYVEQVRGVVSECKPAGVLVPHIIINFDPTAFNPLTPGPYPAANMPDGTWGNHGKVVGGAWVATRFAQARYWKGPQ